MIKPTAGRDYPGSVGELLAWFTSDADCRDYLEWLRWPDGFLCSEPGFADGRARGKKALVCVAVEVKSPKGFGRCRMAIIEDATAKTLHKFIADHIEVGATVITDGWSGYQGIDKLGYFHDRRSQRAAAARRNRVPTQPRTSPPGPTLATPLPA